MKVKGGSESLPADKEGIAPDAQKSILVTLDIFLCF